MIEGQLKQTFSEAEIDKFYADFSDSYAKFHEKNRDAVEIMNSAIDFSKFKTLMLKFKQGAINIKPEEDTVKVGLGSQGMDRFWPLYNDDPTKPGSGWRKAVALNNQKDGYYGQLWQRPCENSPMDLIRMDIRFKKTTKESWFEMLKMGPPIKNAAERRIVEEVNKDERFIYIRMKMPIMSDRENVLHWKREDINEKESLLLIHSVEREDCPIQDKFVRADMYKCQMVRQDEENPEDLYITDVTNMNPKGHLPTRLLNMALGSMMSKGVAELSSALKVLNK